MRRIVVLTFVASLLVVGCNTPGKRLNAPPHGQAYETSDLQGTFTYMTDNALLADMTISDRHFMPHRALLNDLGIQRLTRLASLMDAYGGTIRMNTDLDDEELIDQRTAAVVSFLADAGVDTTQEIIVRDLPGQEGMNATEAILIKTEEGTYKPGQKKSTPTSANAKVK